MTHLKSAGILNISFEFVMKRIGQYLKALCVLDYELISFRYSSCSCCCSWEKG